MAQVTFIFIVEPPSYQYLACYLAASIRNNVEGDVRLVGYCPEERLADVDPNALETLRRMDCEVRTFRTAGVFEPAYPHGNKILACRERRETDFTIFADSDILFINPTRAEDLVAAGHVACSPAASMRWAGQQIWQTVYAQFGLEVPERRIKLMRDKRKDVVPYFSSGLVGFPEPETDGRRFADIWLDTALALETNRDVPGKRPYLDQISLPVAIERAGLAWKELAEEQHYILGGSIRGKPFPDDRPIHAVHYRKWSVLQEAGLAKSGYDGLKRQVGTRRVARIQTVPIPQSSPDQAREVPVESPELKAPPGIDASKAPLAVVTMVHRDYPFLRRWVEYYGGQVGRENLYVLRHGPDPRIDEIAEGANILNVPRLPAKDGFNRRRWDALSQIASGLTLYYNWVLCGDVDELVVVDPDVSDSLPGHLMNRLASHPPAPVVTPLGLEVIHHPEAEPQPLDPESPLLAQRRMVRVHSNYAKPCIIGRRVRFSPGGHGIAFGGAVVDPALVLFHLRYMDSDLSRSRLEERRAFALEKAGTAEIAETSKLRWSKDLEAFEELQSRAPATEEVDLNEVARRIDKKVLADSGNWFGGRWVSKDLKLIPDRFLGLF